MSTRTRSRPRTEDADLYRDLEDLRDEPRTYESAFGLDDDITDDDIADFLAEKEAEEEKPGFWNLPTAAGLATIGVGAAYLLQELGLFAAGFNFSALMGPWLVGVLIILVGFGLLSWSPDRRRKRRRQRRKAAKRKARSTAAPTSRPERRSERKERKKERRASSVGNRYYERKKRFSKSRTNRKMAGVCGGIGEYLGIDPTIVRIAFVIALIAGYGTAIPLYLLLAFVMPNEEAKAKADPDAGAALDDERVIIIR